MSLHHQGPWHYERIVGRTGGNGEWRVADEDADVITDFATEQEAADYVRAHNVNAAARRNPKWRT